MDEFEIDDSFDASFSDDSSLDLFESSGDAFDAMDSAEVPTIEDTSFDSIESGNIEDYSYENTELFNDEVSDVMNGVEVEELVFDDESIGDASTVEVLETEIDPPIEESAPDLIETMDDVETEVLEFDDQVEDIYESKPNSEQYIVWGDGSVDTIENIQANLEAETEQPVEPYEGDFISEAETFQEGDNIETTVDVQNPEVDIETQIENATSVEELTQLRNQILQEGLQEQETMEIDIENQIENASSVEELTQLRNQISQAVVVEGESSNFEEFTPDEYIEDKPKTLHLDMSPEMLESRNRDIEATLDNYRENLQEYGVDEEAIEQFVLQEREKINAEFESLDRGDLDSNHYLDPNDWENIAAGLKENGLEESTIEGSVESTDAINEAIDPSEIDYDVVYEGLDSYDFDGIDYSENMEMLDTSLAPFEAETWSEMSLDEKKGAIADLAEYVQEVTGLENSPEIVYYFNPQEGDYGGFVPDSNELQINEYMLYQNDEAADTVAHELWHAYQHQHSENPQTVKDYQYQYNFNNYIRPIHDRSGNCVNIIEYQDQLVEAEARAFAAQFKGRLGVRGGTN